MKTVCKKLLSLMLVAVLLVSAVPFQVSAAEGETTADPTETTAATTEATVAETTAATVAETTAATTEATVAATEAAPASDETAENVVSQPAVQAVGDTRTVVFFLSEGGQHFASTTVQIGNKLSYVPSANTILEAYADYYGNYIGVNFVRFEVDGFGVFDPYSTNIIDTMVSADGNVYVKAVTEKQATYNVSFLRYDEASASWTNPDPSKFTFEVSAGKTLGSDKFPTQDQINAYFALPGYTIVGWKMHGSNKAFTAGKTTVTQNINVIPRYQRTVNLMANNPDNYTSNSYKTITVEIAEPIPSLPNPGARDGYTFADWVAQDQSTLISTKDNLSNTSAHPAYYPALGSTFYARWTKSTVVYLYIHTNGNTQTASKIVPYYEAPSEGAFDTKLINMYNIFPSYGDYDDEGDTAWGWYSASQWKNYCANTAANAATTFYNVGSNLDYCELHIMLYNNAGSSNVNSNNYNNNSNTADPSNPTTGDMILMAVTVLAVSGAALALIFIVSKKRKASK